MAVHGVKLRERYRRHSQANLGDELVGHALEYGHSHQRVGVEVIEDVLSETRWQVRQHALLVELVHVLPPVERDDPLGHAVRELVVLEVGYDVLQALVEPFGRTVRVHRRQHVRHDPRAQHDAHEHGKYRDHHRDLVIRRHVSVADAGDGLHRPVYRLQPPVAAVVIQVILVVHAVYAPHPVREQDDQAVDPRDRDERVVVDELVLVPVQQPTDTEQPKQLDQPEDAQELEQLQRVRIHAGVKPLRRRAPARMERARQRTFQRPSHQIHRSARHRVDREPRLYVINRDWPRLGHQNTGRLQLLPVPSHKVREHVQYEVKVYEELPPERRAVRRVVERDPVRRSAREVAQHDDLEDIPPAPKCAVGVDVPPPSHGLGLRARIFHGLRVDVLAEQHGLFADGGVAAQQIDGGFAGDHVPHLVPLGQRLVHARVVGELQRRILLVDDVGVDLDVHGMLVSPLIHFVSLASAVVVHGFPVRVPLEHALAPHGLARARTHVATVRPGAADLAPERTFPVYGPHRRVFIDAVEHAVLLPTRPLRAPRHGNSTNRSFAAGRVGRCFVRRSLDVRALSITFDTLEVSTERIKSSHCFGTDARPPLMSVGDRAIINVLFA